MKACLMYLLAIAGFTTLSKATTVSSLSRRHQALLEVEQSGLQGGPSFGALITALRNVGQSVEEEDQAAKTALSTKKGECKSVLAEKKKAINAAKRAKDQAKADLAEYKADAKETDEAIKNLKVDITSSNGELDKLGGKLSKIRGVFAEKRKKIEQELTALDKTITKAQASFAQFLPAGDNVGFSFVQTSEEQGSALRGPGNVKALKADKSKVQASLDKSKDAFMQEESKLLGLIKTERKKLQELQQDLESKQPALAETEEKISETHRKITSAERSIKRDQDLRKAVDTSCDRWIDNSKSQTKIRRDALTQIKMAVKLLQTMDGSFLFQKDLGNETLQAAVSFLQTRSKMQFEGVPDFSLSDSSATEETENLQGASALQEGTDASFQAVATADPFANVKKLIQGLIANIKAEDAKDGNQQKYCDEQYGKNRRDQMNRKNDLDLKLAEVRNHENQITKYKDDLGFFSTEISRLQQEIAKSNQEMTAMEAQVKSEIEDHNLAIRILEQSIHALKTLCGLSLMQTATGTTHRNAQCKEVVEIVGDAKKKFKEQNAAAQAAVQEMKDLTKTSVADATKAKQSKESEKSTTTSTLGSRKDALMQAKDDVKSIQADLESLKGAKENLDQQCGPNIVDPADKIKRLQEEIDALKNALQVLNGEAIPSLVQEWPQTPVAGPSALQRAADAIGLEQ